MKNISIILILVIAITSKLTAQDTTEMPETLLKLNDFYGSSERWSSLKDHGYNSYRKITMSGEQFGILKVSTTGELDTITKAIFDQWNYAAECGILVSSNNKKGVIDSTGKFIIPTQYDDILPIIDGRCFVKNGEKYALASSSGKLLTQFIFDDVYNFEGGIARVIINNKNGYIDLNGKYIVQPQFNDATDFSYGFAKVFYDKWETIYKGEAYQGLRTTNVNVGYTKSIPFIINKKGVKIFAAKEGDNIGIIENGYVEIDRPGKSTMIDTSGKVIVPFDKQLLIVNLTKNWIVVRNMNDQGKYGILDYRGKELLKPAFWGFDKLQYNGGKLGKAYYNDKNDFFYIDKNCNCVEFNNVKCPDKD